MTEESPETQEKKGGKGKKLFIPRRCRCGYSHAHVVEAPRQVGRRRRIALIETSAYSLAVIQHAAPGGG